MPASTFSRRALSGVLALAGLATLVGIGYAGLLRSTRLRETWPAEADTFYLPPSSALRAASLRHTELFADLIHARANVYFGTQLHARVPTKWLANYLNSAIDLDPKFQRLYLAGAAMLIYNGQRIMPDMVLAAVDILERGRKAFPFEWEFPFQIGFNLLYELPQDAGEDDPRVPGWRQQGVEMLRQAALYEGVPYYIPNLVARMLTKGGADDLAIRHLEQAFAVATNPEVRTQIRGKLLLLRGQQFSDQVEENRRSFSAMIATRFPYAPEAFSIVAGSRTTAMGIVAPPRLPASQESKKDTKQEAKP
jgi:hypothetical protein